MNKKVTIALKTARPLPIQNGPVLPFTVLEPPNAEANVSKQRDLQRILRTFDYGREAYNIIKFLIAGELGTGTYTMFRRKHRLFRSQRRYRKIGHE